jgi:hypothetical protein
MHFLVAFGLDVSHFLGRKLAHADALDAMIELSVNGAANGANECAEVEDDGLRALLRAIKALLVAAHLLNGADAVDKPLLLFCLTHCVDSKQMSVLRA